MRISFEIRLRLCTLLSAILFYECFDLFLGSVHKYFGGGAGQLKIFVVKLFWPPLRKPPKLFEPPLNMCENLFDPPPPLLHV